MTVVTGQLRSGRDGTARAGGPRGLGLAPLVLPRAAALTDLLVAPSGAHAGLPAAGDEGCTVGELDDVQRRLLRDLSGASGHSAGKATGRPASRSCRAGVPRLRVTGYHLRAAVDPFAGAPPSAVPAPFAWTAEGARRALGLVAVRCCVAATARTPAEAVARVVADLTADGRHGLGRRGSLAEWLGGMPAPSRAIVGAEATTWATRLWTAVEWCRLGPGVQIGAPDTPWVPPGTAVTLRGRCDVRIPGPGGRATLLTMLPGRPGPACRAELGLGALVAALSAPRPSGGGPVLPWRVAGWWPDCGRALVIAVDRALLEETAGAVVQAVAACMATASATSATSADREGTADR